MDSKKHLFLLSFLFFTSFLFAQGTEGSFILDNYQKAQAYKSQDSLAAWVKVYFDAANSDHEKYCSYFDSILIQQWRLPKDNLEALPLLNVAFFGRYYYKIYGDIHTSTRFCEYGNQLYESFPLADYDINGNIRQALANNYTRLGEYKKAEVIHKKILLDAIEKKDNNLNAATRINLSIVYQDLGVQEEVIEQCRLGLELSNVKSNNRAVLKSLMGNAYLQLGKYDGAKIYMKEAMNMLEAFIDKGEEVYEEDSIHLSSIYADYGKLLIEIKDQKNAKLYLKRALKVAIRAHGTDTNREIGKIRLLLGEWYLKNGTADAALDAYNKALSSIIQDFRPKLPFENPTEEDLFEENTIFQALTGKSRALKAIYLKDKNIEALETALECHELAFQTEQKLRSIYQVESSKLELQLSSRERDGEAMEVVYLLYEESKEKQYLKKGFQIAEQSKSTVLLDALANNLLKQEIENQDTLLIQEQRLKNYIAIYEKGLLEEPNQQATEAQLLEFQKELAVVQEEIREKYPKLEQQLQQQKQISIKDATALLKEENSFLIEYFVGEEDLYIFTLSKDQNLTLERVPFESLEKNIQGFSQLTADRIGFQNDPQNFYDLAHSIYQPIFPKHLQQKIDSGKLLDLIIVPDGVLNVCSFDVLLTQKYEQGTVPYLIHQAKIDYAYSVSSLRYQQQMKSEAKKNVLGIIPVFEKQERGLASLQYSQEESKNMPFFHSRNLKKSQASLRAFHDNFRDYRILHFSTHAQADSSSQIPRIEFIDSTLFLPEIYGLPLQSDLVVLSACQTALGADKSGEGLMSLARGFAYSGASSLVASLWKVNNKSTSDLMSAFYKHLGQGSSKSDALRQAKLDYLSEVSLAQQSPYYWSGMVFIGADGMVEFDKSLPTIAWISLGGVLFLAVISLFFYFR